MIIFDIDDTITCETEFMMKHAPQYLKKKYKCTFHVVNEYGYDVSEVFGIREFLIKNDFPVEQIGSELEKINLDFWNRHFLMYIFYPIKKDAKKIINGLKREGYRIVFVSTRGKETSGTGFGKIVKKKAVSLLTKIQLKINGIRYDKLVLVQSNEQKVLYAKRNRARYIFDDNIEVINSCQMAMKAVCIETPHNLNALYDDNSFVRIPFAYNSVNKLLEKTKNNKYREIQLKDLKEYQRIYTELWYRVLRAFGKKKVEKLYKPIVLGKENIPPRREASVFVGNHRNIKDPLVLIALLKKPVHFAALKRMFEYNENFFGTVGKNFGTRVTTLLVKSIGALPIARPTDNEYMYTNLQTFKYIDDYLRKNSSVAIYPEGTLNRKPDEDGNILKIKSSRVFKIAENEKTVVRPIAIVWAPKELEIENKVIISFLKPIYTDGLSAAQIDEMWHQCMNAAIDSINKIFLEMGNMVQ